MLWRGRIYSSLPFVRALYRDRLNTGTWGTAAFPSIYNVGASGLTFLPASAGWLVLVLTLMLAGALLEVPYHDAARAAFILGSAGLLTSVIRCMRFASQADFPAARLRDRLLVAALHLIQPLARLRGRIRGHFAAPTDLTRLGCGHDSSRAAVSRPCGRADGGVRLERKFWSEAWTSLPTLLDQLVNALAASAARAASTSTKAGPSGGMSRCRSAASRGSKPRGLVEEHTRGACLVRMTTRIRPTGSGLAGLLFLAGAIMAAMLLERWGHNSGSLVVVLACAFALVVGLPPHRAGQRAGARRGGRSGSSEYAAAARRRPGLAPGAGRRCGRHAAGRDGDRGGRLLRHDGRADRVGCGRRLLPRPSAAAGCGDSARVDDRRCRRSRGA